MGIHATALNVGELADKQLDDMNALPHELERAPVALLTLDEALVVRAVNDLGAAYFHLSASDMRGKPLEELVLLEHRAELTSHIASVVATDARSSFELTFDARGARIVLAMTSALLQCPKTQELLCVSTLFEVTALREREESQRMLAEASVALSGIYDERQLLEQLVSFIVPSLGSTCIISLLDDNGRASSPVVVDDGPPPSEHRVEALRAMLGAPEHPLQSGRAHHHVDVDEHEHPRSIVSVPLTTGAYRLGALTVLSTRMHSLARSERELIEELGRRTAFAMENVRLHAEARRAIRAREDVLALVTHDLKNQLLVMLLNTSALLRLPRDEDKRARSRRRIESIHNAAERMDHMMSDLLDCASIDRNQLRLEAKPCGVRALIAESIDAVEALAQEKELELAYEINDGIEDLVCDRERVMRVLLNLLWNAIDFTPDHGKVIVRAGRQGEDVRICVTDGGPGVPRDVRERIFERHWRARGAAHLGHGLGLFIAHGIVVAHGGHIWVDDAPGCGAVFAFTIPVRIPDPLPPFGSEPPSLRIEAGE